MVYCSKCGNQVEESMAFCPRCGAPLKAEAPVHAVRRNEKAEKNEKGEKQEKNEPEKSEKHEKGEFAFLGWLIGGLILVFMGAMAFLNLQYHFVNTAMGWALFLLVIGVIIIIVAVYFATTARKRSPSPV
ncbi:MAG: zinc ribbon domain-containing protein [Candidatus Bathyarchaeota archaeon]|nr:zinc ribbon domain-containing protein [Candidatus Bathyarchaeota archaeon]